jgi:hypothetical protein
VSFLKLSSCRGALLVACGLVLVSSLGRTQGMRTDALAADGGDLGKAFADLTAAFKAADKARAAKLLDAAHWNVEAKQGSWFAQLSEQLSTFQVTGGRRQGARATLFVVSKDGYYGMLNATFAGTWRFDSPTPTGSSVSGPNRDCKASPTRFPCGLASAPDAQVSGTAQSHMIDPDTKKPAPPVALIDGLAVRMVNDANAVQTTWVVLSGTGINPQMTARAEDPDQIAGWLGYPVLKLAIAPGGKTAKAEFYNGYARQEFDVTRGLAVDPATPSRIRGSLKTDVKDIAAFNVTFDLGAAATCAAGKSQCGS